MPDPAPAWKYALLALAAGAGFAGLVAGGPGVRLALAAVAAIVLVGVAVWGRRRDASAPSWRNAPPDLRQAIARARWIPVAAAAVMGPLIGVSRELLGDRPLGALLVGAAVAGVVFVAGLAADRAAHRVHRRWMAGSS